MSDVGYLVWSTILTWLMLMVAAALKYGGLSPRDIALMVGNREQLPPPSALAGRADRAAKNMFENFVIFIALVAAVHFSGKESAQASLGAAIFFWARLVYWPVYLAGIKYLRSALWFVGIVGMAVILLAIV